MLTVNIDFAASINHHCDDESDANGARYYHVTPTYDCLINYYVNLSKWMEADSGVKKKLRGTIKSQQGN